MTTSPSSPAEAIRNALMAWYAENGRHALPWRQSRDPYAVLVSEVMLQQTQVDRVLPYYEAWMLRWPTAESLAAESAAEVIRAWAGLGYNRRALNLHRAAQQMAQDGEPTSLDQLRSLPGVGPYTAAAVASFALEQRVAVADTNIARLLARTSGGKQSQRDLAAREVSDAAERLLPEEGCRDHNLALMDLGATVCTSRSPRCEACPLASQCAWRLADYPAGAAVKAVAPRFEETARFARGRIVDALRAVHSISAGELMEMLPTRHRAAVPRYLSALQRDGLVVQTASGDWTLPGAATAG